MNARIQRLKEDSLSTPKSVCIERARWLTRFYRGPGAGLPPLMQRAGAVRFALNHIPVKIYPGELIAGAMTERRMGALLYPEFSSLALWPELKKLHERKENPFRTEPGEIEELEKEIFPFWLGKTVGDRALSMAGNVNPAGKIALKAQRIVIEAVKRAPFPARKLFFDSVFKSSDSVAAMYRSYEPFRLFTFEGVYVLTEFAGISHVTPDYLKIVNEGFGRIIEQAEDGLGKTSAPQERLFLEAVKSACAGVVEFAERYASEAEALALKEPDPGRQKELRGIAARLRNAPRNPARSFHEALQAIWITQIALHHENYEQAISLGRLDQYLYPLYRKDVEAGRLSRENAKELLQAMWIKMSGFIPVFPEMFNRHFSGLMTSQAVCVGGIGPDAKDATNELSLLILESARDLNTPQPNLFARVHRGSSPSLLETIAANISAGCPHPAVYNDEVIISALEKAGVSTEDARDFAPLGCVEPNPQGRTFGSTDAALINLGLCMELALRNGVSAQLCRKIGAETGKPEDFRSMVDVVEAFRKQVSHVVGRMVEGTNLLSRAHAEHFPSPLLSSLIGDTLKKRRDVTMGGARYNFSGVQGVGVAEVADSLAALEEVVFRKKMGGMKDLVRALQDDFEGHADLHAFIRNKVPKFGEDEGLAEKYAGEVMKIYSDEVVKHANPRGGRYTAGFYSVTTHVPFGRFVGALPSGRRSGEPLSNGISPAQAGLKKGPTAALRAVASLDHTVAANGVNFTFGIDPAVASSRELFVPLLRTYLRLGGMQIQFNVLDEAMLLDARRNPDRYRWLVVRVAGYSAYFTELTPEVQEEILRRVAAAATAKGDAIMPECRR